MFTSINGLPFKLKVSESTGTVHSLTCEIKEALVMKSVLESKAMP